MTCSTTALMDVVVFCVVVVGARVGFLIALGIDVLDDFGCLDLRGPAKAPHNLTH